MCCSTSVDWARPTTLAVFVACPTCSSSSPGSSAANVVATRAAASRLRDESPTRLGLLVVGPDRPYPAAEVAEACGLDLLGSLPHDPAGALAWQGLDDGRGGRGDPLWHEASAGCADRSATIEPLAHTGGAA